MYDNETGFYYLKARLYDSTVKRFISADTIIMNVGERAIGYNLYQYAYNNPVSYSDSTGHMPELTQRDWMDIAEAGLLITLMALGTGAIVVSGGLATGTILLCAEGILVCEGAASVAVIIALTEEIAEVGVAVAAVATGAMLATGNGKEEQHSKPSGENKENRTSNEKPSLKPYKNGKEANAQSVKQGYENAHELKEEFVGKNGSRFDIKYDSNTGQIFLENKAGTIQIPTGLYNIR